MRNVSQNSSVSHYRRNVDKYFFELLNGEILHYLPDFKSSLFTVAFGTDGDKVSQALDGELQEADSLSFNCFVTGAIKAMEKI